MKSLRVGKHPHEIALSPGGMVAYITNNGSMRYSEDVAGGNTLTVIDTEALQEIDSKVPGALRCAVVPDGSMLITASRWKGIAFIGTKTVEMLHHLQLPFQPFSLTLSFDGLYAFASTEPEGICYIISVEDRKIAYTFRTKAGAWPDPFYGIEPLP